jgi:hypothetical protein
MLKERERERQREREQQCEVSNRQTQAMQNFLAEAISTVQ